MPIKWLWKQLLTKTKLGRVLSNKYGTLIDKFNSWPEFVQKFIISLMVGLLSYALFVAGINHSIKTFVQANNLVFDSSLAVFNLFTDKSDYIEDKPVLIVFDEESYQDRGWSKTNKDNHKAQFNNDIVRLVDKAYEKNSRHVFIDFLLKSSDDVSRQQNLAIINNLINKYKNSPKPHHLYVVVGTTPDTCMVNIDYFNKVENSIWEGIPLNTGNFYIHPVSPTIYEDEDKIVRKWSLFSINQYAPTNGETNKNYRQWTFLPSPQLAYHVVSQLEQDAKNESSTKLKMLPWLNSFKIQKAHSITKISRHSYTSDIYNQLMTLTQSKQLKSFCSKSTAQCLQAKYFSNGNKYSKSEKTANQLFADLPYVSPKCEERISAFTDKYTINRKINNTLENRIIYSMRSWHESLKLEDYDDAYYDLYTPKSITSKSNQSLLNNSTTWEGKFVAIGAAYKASRDINYQTPIGAMPGVLINLNAISSFDSFGAIGLLSPLKNLLLNIAILTAAAFLFAFYRAKSATVIILVSITLFVLLFTGWMFAHGVWIQFGLPLFIMNIVSFFIERREDTIEKRSKLKMENEQRRIQDKLKIAELKIQLLQSKIEETPWEFVRNDEKKQL